MGAVLLEASLGEARLVRFRASPAGRHKPVTQSVRLGPFVSADGQKMGYSPAGLGSAPTGLTHIVRARVLSDLDGL
jgi:hypothetical protein